MQNGQHLLVRQDFRHSVRDERDAIPRLEPNGRDIGTVFQIGSPKVFPEHVSPPMGGGIFP